MFNKWAIAIVLAVIITALIWTVALWSECLVHGNSFFYCLRILH